MFSDSKAGYRALEEGVEDGSAPPQHDAIALTARIEVLRRSNKRYAVIALILACIAIFQAGWIFKLLIAQPDPTSNKVTGFTTEFASAREALANEDYIERTFSGNWVWDNETQYVTRHVDLSQPQYFGDPSKVPEIELNWRNLLEAEFPSLKEEEEAPFHDLNPVTPFSQKFIELDVTHSLHCVNHLRMMLYAHYYNDTLSAHHTHGSHDPEGFREMHMDHCLEQLFETVKCNSDLTPAPIYSFVPGTRKATLAVGQTHTCRNFDSVRKWLYQRAGERPSINSVGRVYKPKDAKLSSTGLSS